MSYPMADALANGIEIALNAVTYGILFCLTAIGLRTFWPYPFSAQLIWLGTFIAIFSMIAMNLVYGFGVANLGSPASVTGAVVSGSAVYFLSGLWFCVAWWVMQKLVRS
jgi:hypothetical protein